MNGISFRRLSFAFMVSTTACFGVALQGSHSPALICLFSVALWVGGVAVCGNSHCSWGMMAICGSGAFVYLSVVYAQQYHNGLLFMGWLLMLHTAVVLKRNLPDVFGGQLREILLQLYGGSICISMIAALHIPLFFEFV